MRVLVTGATGLVGGHLTGRLLERGDEVHALVRDRVKAEPIERQGAVLVDGDLSDANSLRTALSDYDVVYHCAAQVALPHQGDRDHILDTNAQGTRDLLQACIDARVKRFVFVSSVAVYGGSQTVGISEEHPYAASGHYSESKILAEEAVRELEANSDIEVVILRPCVIYGPGDHNFLPPLMESFIGGFFPLVSGGKQLLDMVYVSDVADAIVLAGTAPQAAGQAYNITDGKQHSIKEIVQAVERNLDRPFKGIYLPYFVAYVAAAVIYSISKLIKPKADPLISPAGIRSLKKSHHYKIEKIQEDLGYYAKVDLNDGIQRTLEWYADWKAENLGNGQHSLQGGY